MQTYHMDDYKKAVQVIEDAYTKQSHDTPIPGQIDLGCDYMKLVMYVQTQSILSTQTASNETIQRLTTVLEKNNELLSPLLDKMGQANRVTTMEEMYRDSACVDTVQVPDFTDDTDI